MSDIELERVPCPLCGCQQTQHDRVLRGYSLERCSACSFVFVNPQPTAESLQRIYTVTDSDAKVEVYERLATDKVLHGYDVKLEEIERWVGGTGRLLDYACAAGYFYERALRRGWEAHGLDIGDWCRLAAEKRDLPNMHIGGLDELDVGPGYFDVVYAGQVFEHLPRPKEEVSKLFGMLRPGGLLFANVPNYRSLSVLLGRDQFALNTPPQHINYFTPKTLQHLVTDTGFLVLGVNADGGLNWENILGIRVRSDILNAYYEPNRLGEKKRLENGTINVPPSGIVKRTLMSVIKPLLYDAAKLGICLNIIAQRPKEAGSNPK